MKITCLIHSLDGGGAERVMAGLASRLAQRNHCVTLVTLDDGQGDRHPVDAAVIRRPLDVMSDSRWIFSAIANTRRRVRTVRQAFAESKPDIVLSFCDRTNILALLAIRGTRIPIVISERSDPSEQHLGRLWEFLRRRTYPNASMIVAQTESSAAHLREMLGWSSRQTNPHSGQQIRVIASAVEDPPLTSDRAVAIQNRRIVGMGRLEQEKGFDRLIEAFAVATESKPDWTLKILGKGSLRSQLQSQACELGIESRVSMPGWVRPVWNELASATLFVLPSRYEGFPSALLEAMAMGVPSIATDCESGPRAIIEHERNGLLVSSDTSGLAAGIQRLIENDELRESIGSEGVDVVRRFGWDAMVDAYEELLIQQSQKLA